MKKLLILIIIIAGIFFSLEKFYPQYRWQTYQNEELGYEIKYPSNFSLNSMNANDAEQGIVIEKGNIVVRVCRQGCGTMGGVGIGTTITEETLTIDGMDYEATEILSQGKDGTRKLFEFSPTPESTTPFNSITIRYTVVSPYD